ncbi:MAG: BolA family transcriptional regulator [Acidocella sp. 20-57-95]|nr:MAG: BolA family transcriptional regulator [Acidocella sp. 20-57-95]OYV58454.1 MAG: BolA family transcriptional regulator [Acidocella sp. 21-58-7]HQT65107.1 BolA family protein [Acidocella sp.]HQU03657.1 BolA family protein [Acidocella sp.]
MTSRYDRIFACLAKAFTPITLEIIDESAKHASHIKRTGVPHGGETHYNVLIVSDAFTGMSRVARSRAVHQALDAEFKTGLHALSMKLSAPGEV